MSLGKTDRERRGWEPAARTAGEAGVMALRASGGRQGFRENSETAPRTRFFLAAAKGAPIALKSNQFKDEP
jgi:hypothetical protein